VGIALLFMSLQSAWGWEIDQTLLSAGYHGDLITHPGVAGSLLAAPVGNGRVRLLAGGTTAAFIHPYNHYAVTLIPEAGVRVIPERLPSGAVLLGAGALYRRVAGETVGFNDPGRLAALFTVRWPWAIPLGDALYLTASVQLGWEYPHNNHVLFRPALQIGLGWIRPGGER